jgi:hypothetical protein
MKAFFVLCHQSPKLHGEIREAIVARELRALGIDAQLFRPWAGNTNLSNMFEDIVPVTFCPLDQPTADVHESISTPLIERVAAERPDLVIFKGLDYDLVGAQVGRLDLSATRIAFVIGGVAVHPALKSACLVLTESEQQTQAIYDFLVRRIPIRILSKYINWNVADQAYAAAQATDDKKYDIVNVGYFEDRKNQIELRRFFGKRSVAIVGHGPTLDATKEAATGYEGVTFFGDLPNESALRVMSQARLMVHTALGRSAAGHNRIAGRRHPGGCIRFRYPGQAWRFTCHPPCLAGQPGG